MKRAAFLAAVGTLSLIAWIPGSSAEPMSLVIDRAHSSVGFDIRHFFSRVHGEFTDFEGTITFDPKNVSASAVAVNIKSSSIYTGIADRDENLRSEDFFWVAKYPTLAFKSTRTTAVDSTHFKVAGDLTIRNVTKPVTLDAELLGMGKVGVGGRDLGMLVGFEARTKINRKDFGIVWNRTVDQGGLMLGDEVQIVLSVEAGIPSSPQPSSK